MGAAASPIPSQTGWQTLPVCQDFCTKSPMSRINPQSLSRPWPWLLILPKNLPVDHSHLKHTSKRILDYVLYLDSVDSLPDGSVVKNLPANAGGGFHPWVWKIPWSRKWQTTPVSFPGISHGQRSLMGYSPWGSKRVGHEWAHSMLDSLQRHQRSQPLLIFSSL